MSDDIVGAHCYILGKLILMSMHTCIHFEDWQFSTHLTKACRAETSCNQVATDSAMYKLKINFTTRYKWECRHSHSHSLSHSLCHTYVCNLFMPCVPLQSHSDLHTIRRWSEQFSRRCCWSDTQRKWHWRLGTNPFVLFVTCTILYTHTYTVGIVSVEFYDIICVCIQYNMMPASVHYPLQTVYYLCMVRFLFHILYNTHIHISYTYIINWLTQ